LERNEKKLHTARLVTVILFTLAIASLFVLLLVLPKRAGELSPLEFRTLANYPWKSGENNMTLQELEKSVFKGKFAENVDSFLEDHFPGRSFFIALDAYYMRLTGRNADQSVVKGKNGRLFDAASKPDMEQLGKNIDRIEAFAEANGLRTTYLIVPTSADVVKDELPALSLEYHDADIIEYLKERGLNAPDLIALMSAEAYPGSLLYRTDHHWTMAGAYLCYREVCPGLGIEPVSREAFTVESYDFYGSYYRKAGLWLTEPDMLEVWRNARLDSAAVTLNAGPNERKLTGVYDPEKLKEGEVDRYAAYLYSNNGLTVIDLPDGNGKTLMILKDSFGNSIAPLFAMNYSRVIMIDTREYRDPSLPAPSELAAEYGIEDFLIVLGTDSAASLMQIEYLR
jgi:hypothetical protein